MRVGKPIKLILPTKVVEKVGEIQNKERYLYFVHYLLKQSIFNNRIADSYKGFTPISKEKLQDAIGCNTDSYIKYLLNDEIIERDYYKIKVKPYYYKINSDLINGDYTEIDLFSNLLLYENIIKIQRNKRANYNRLEPHLKEMQRHIMNVSFDYQNACRWIENNSTDEKKLSYLIAVNQIEDKRFRYFKRNKTNYRLDTNFTNLKSELRQFIKGDFMQIDLRNSQPFFLSVLLSKMLESIKGLDDKLTHTNRKLLRTIPICLGFNVYDIVNVFGIQHVKEFSKVHQNGYISEMMNFRNSVLNGSFYDDFIKFYGVGITRKEVKSIMFKVLFSQNENGVYKKEKDIFKTVYPIIYQAVELLKAKEYNQLAIVLQKMESKVFIDMIAKELVSNEIIPITIHDSVIVPESKQDEALRIIKQVFYNEMNVIPTFEVTGL